MTETVIAVARWSFSDVHVLSLFIGCHVAVGERERVAPRLSIVVPFFGVEEYIGECLNSIARQTFEDFEVLLIDDGSTDNSATIARDFAARDPRFTIITQENQGLGPARNTGVEHSVGEFVTFADSDDVVPWHAYELLIRLLDETGSSFAGGNVRRLSRAGVRESLVHRIPFARDRRATHVLEFPELAGDRMIWNKVYRRSFWDEFGYEFPAMRYEDYPVTLRAHLDAVTVDCVSAPVYLWREREFGESITDRSDEYSNMADRVTGAEMVIDLVKERAPELSQRVQRHLVRVDLLVLLQAFLTIGADDEQSFVELGQRLVNRLDTAVLEQVHALTRLQIHALRSGDVAFLKEMAAYRLDHDVFDDAPIRRRWAIPWRYERVYPGRTERPRRAPRSIYRVRRDEFSLRTTVQSVCWTESTVTVRGTAEIRHLHTGSRSRLRVFLVGDGVELPCEIARFTTADSRVDPGLVGFEVRIRDEIFADVGRATRSVHLVVEMVNGRFRRRGQLREVRPGHSIFADGHSVSRELWVQPLQQPSGLVTFELTDNPARLTSAEVRDGVFVLAGTLSANSPAADLNVASPFGLGHRTVKLDRHDSDVGFTCRIPLGDIVDGFDPEDPSAQRVTCVVRLAAADGDLPLVPVGLDHAVGGVHDSSLVVLTRTPSNETSFAVSPVQFLADNVGTITAEPPRLLVGGPLLGCPHPRAFVWCGSIDPAGEPVGVRCETSFTGDRWSAVVDLRDVAAEPNIAHEIDQGANVTLTLTSVAEGASGHPVRADDFLWSQFPIEVRHGSRTAAIVSDVGLLRLRVR